MSTERAYLDDPFRIEFTADVMDRVVLPDGRKGVVLTRTYFCPTGGGQEHDTGTLGDARVTDVLIGADANVVHVVDREITAATVVGKINWQRRFAFMQHHSAQHLLSQAITNTLNLETVSANINIDSPSTVDLDAGVMHEVDLSPAEELANSIIYEDRPIKSYFIGEDQIHTIPFRSPPKVKGRIRVVEIEKFDYSACGGTHCTRTGMIGIIKILKPERRAEKLRVHFVAGGRAFKCFRDYHAIVMQVARQFDTSPEAIVEAAARQQESLRVQQKELEGLRSERLLLQVKQLVANAEPFDSVRLVLASFRDRTPQELRALAMLLQEEPGVIALLAAFDGTKLSLAVSCAKDVGIHADALICRQLAEIGGRGGGNAWLAQGGGTVSEEQFESFFAYTKEHIRALRGTV